MLDTFQTFLLIVLVLLGINYLTAVFIDRIVLSGRDNPVKSLTEEGFEDGSEAKGAQGTMLANDDLYDDFYASVYDKLAQGIERSAGKVALVMTQWKNWGMEPANLRVLDAGCGTGVASVAFTKLGAGRVIGLDLSEAMLRQARNVTLPATTLTQSQKDSLEWRKGDLLNPSAVAASEVNAAVVFYFTIYYMKDLDAFFRNMGVWVAPGGFMVVEVVNKYKFDPILDSASPFAGFSIQKYADKRMTKSKVHFDKFDYEAEFKLHEGASTAEFREAFQFKDGSKRKQKHHFIMPDIKNIVNSATYAGWTYKASLDTTALGFEYGFLLFFTH